MNKIKTMAAISGTALGLMFLTSATSAQDVGVCNIVDGRVVCVEDVQDRKAVLDAMSNPASLKYFNDLLKKTDVSLDIDRRETYRRSLERNRRAMHRYARAQLRQLRRGRLSAADYEKITVKYADAVATYKSALNVYRSTIWHSKVPPLEDVE